MLLPNDMWQVTYDSDGEVLEGAWLEGSPESWTCPADPTACGSSCAQTTSRPAYRDVTKING